MQQIITNHQPRVYWSPSKIALMRKKSIFDRIVEARRDAGLPTTQISIAKELGISTAAVNKWAKGAGVSTEHILELAYSSGAAVEWLLSGRPPKRAHDESSSVGRLLTAFEALPEDVQEEVLRFAEFRGKAD